MSYAGVHLLDFFTFNSLCSDDRDGTGYFSRESAVTTVCSPEEAIAMLDKSDCDLVISDVEICTEWKRHLIQEMRRKKDCPILLLTRGGCETQDRCKDLESGRGWSVWSNRSNGKPYWIMFTGL